MKSVLSTLCLCLLAATARADVIMDWNAKADDYASEQHMTPTEHARVLAMLHVVIAEQLVDTEFVEAHTTGFEHRRSDWSRGARLRQPDPRLAHQRLVQVHVSIHEAGQDDPPATIEGMALALAVGLRRPIWRARSDRMPMTR